MKTFEVTYISHLGNDSEIASIGSKTNDNDDISTVLDNLVQKGIKEPFLLSQITLQETVPLYIAIKRFKHQIGFTYIDLSIDINEENIYTPLKWIEDTLVENIGYGDIELSEDKQNLVNSLYKASISNCLDTYNKLLEQGVHPSQAFMVLPQSLAVSYYVTGSVYSFAKSFKYLHSEAVTEELQQLAIKEHNVLSKLFPLAWSALINGLSN